MRAAGFGYIAATMDPLEEAIAPCGAHTLTDREAQRLVHALDAVLGAATPPWVEQVRRLRVARGDVAPWWRAMARQATWAQARAFRDVFVRAFGITR